MSKTQKEFLIIINKGNWNTDTNDKAHILNNHITLCGIKTNPNKTNHFIETTPSIVFSGSRIEVKLCKKCQKRKQEEDEN